MAPEKIYWIQTSDRLCLAMSENDVGTLVEMMPTLSFLLFGHPQMQPKVLKKSYDGIEVLEIDPALQVSQSSFILMVNCIRGATPLPARSGVSRLTELEETMIKLGGCESLENRLRDHSANPLTPEEDTEGKFIWNFIRQSAFVPFSMDPSCRREGYSVASTEDDGISIAIYLRKRR